jgi:hypothetical protein
LIKKGGAGVIAQWDVLTAMLIVARDYLRGEVKGGLFKNHVILPPTEATTKVKSKYYI